jgi:type II secretory pathway component PulK
MADFYRTAQLTPSDMAKVFDSLTAKQGSIKGLVNVNTAPQQVLQALPGLEQSDAQSIVAQRSSGEQQNGAGAGWVFNAITDKNKAYQIADSITGESYQYSADIVAVSSDGRTFKRVRVIVDGSKSPAVIIYRRDLTSFGWPLRPEIRDQMKLGKFVSNTNGNEPAQGQLDNGLNSSGSNGLQ